MPKISKLTVPKTFSKLFPTFSLLWTKVMRGKLTDFPNIFYFCWYYS